MAELTEGESYLVRVTITNQSTMAGTPVEATFEVTVYGEGAIAYLFPSVATSEPFSAGQTRAFDYPLNIPSGYGGQSGRVWAAVRDPAGAELTSVFVDITIKTKEAPPVPEITNAKITKVQEVGDELAATVGVTFNNTGAFISSSYPDDAAIEVWILNPACPAMETEPLFFTRFGNRDIPAGVNIVSMTVDEKIIYLTGYRTTPIGPGSTPVTLRIKLIIFSWAGSPYKEAEFSDTLVW